MCGPQFPNSMQAPTAPISPPGINNVPLQVQNFTSSATNCAIRHYDEPAAGVGFDDGLHGFDLFLLAQVEFFASVTADHEPRQGGAAVPVDVAS